MTATSPDTNPFRSLPSVDELLHSPAAIRLLDSFSHQQTVQALRTGLAQAREDIRAGKPCPTVDQLLTTTAQLLFLQQRAQLRPVINATGVILHTNLGRAPLSTEALQAVQRVSLGYSNLEYDLEAGERGSRHSHVTQLLREVTGAEAALVVNNNAAAVLLALSTLAQGREVVISRGQLVEIGGGFRVPDVMRQSGCTLVEVGTTNRTRIADYAAVLSERTGLLLTVHPSNFRITGFTESTSVRALSELAHAHNLLVMDDLGSGCLLPGERYGLTHEPMPQESLAAGADLVCFSGDKLLGGPQAGILLGRQEVIARLARHPLMRALRVDKMTLAALETTLRHYQRGEAETHIPIWRMITLSQEKLSARVSHWASMLRSQGIEVQIQRGESTIGGGSLPGETLPTLLLALHASTLSVPLEELTHRLRNHHTPIVARIAHNALLLDLRTVLEEQDEDGVQALIDVLNTN